MLWQVAAHVESKASTPLLCHFHIVVAKHHSSTKSCPTPQNQNIVHHTPTEIRGHANDLDMPSEWDGSWGGSCRDGLLPVKRRGWTLNIFDCEKPLKPRFMQDKPDPANARAPAARKRRELCLVGQMRIYMPLLLPETKPRAMAHSCNAKLIRGLIPEINLHRQTCRWVCNYEIG